MEQNVELISAKEAAELFKVHLNTIYRWLESGELKGIRVGETWRVDKAEIKRMLQTANPEN